MRISDWSSDVCSSDLMGALLQPLRFQQLSLGLKLLQPLGELVSDRLHRLLERRSGGHIMAVREHADIIEAGALLAGQGIELDDFLHFVAEEIYPPGEIGRASGRARVCKYV